MQRRLLWCTCICTALLSWITHAHLVPLSVTKLCPLYTQPRARRVWALELCHQSAGNKMLTYYHCMKKSEEAELYSHYTVLSRALNACIHTISSGSMVLYCFFPLSCFFCVAEPLEDLELSFELARELCKLWLCTSKNFISCSSSLPSLTVSPLWLVIVLILPLEAVLESLFKARDWTEEYVVEAVRKAADFFFRFVSEFLSFVSDISTLFSDVLRTECLAPVNETPDGLVKFLEAELGKVFELLVLELDGGFEDWVLAKLAKSSLLLFNISVSISLGVATCDTGGLVVALPVLLATLAFAICLSDGDLKYCIYKMRKGTCITCGQWRPRLDCNVCI